jgi:uncharacterized protein (UPF0332 family)
MKVTYKRCLEMGKIVKFNIGIDMVQKELMTGAEDLNTAKTSLSAKNYKWATIQGYYAFFHAIRALLFLKKLREKSHRCLLEALKALYIDKGQVPPEYYDKFSVAMELRESADYRSAYSENDASRVIQNASQMIRIADRIIGAGPKA